MTPVRHSELGSRIADLALRFAAPVILLVPFATVTLSPRRALVTAAAGKTALTLAAVAATVRWRDVGAALRSARRPILVGLALHAAATTLGAIVGAVRGNDPTLLAGQVLALALLPLAAATLVAPARAERWRWLATGLAVVLSCGAVAQIAGAHWHTGGHGQWTRFALPNGVTLASGGILVFAIAFSLLRTPRGATRAVGATAILAAVTLVALSLTRTHMLGLLVAGGTLAALATARGARPLSRAAVVIAGATLAILLLPAAAWLWWGAPRPPLQVDPLPAGPTEISAPPRGATGHGRFIVRLATVAAPRGDLVRIAGRIACDTDSAVVVGARPVEPGARPLRETGTGVIPLSGVPFAFVVLAPGADGVLGLEVSRPDPAPCRLLEAGAVRLAPAALAPAVTRVWRLVRRPPDPDPGEAASVTATDSSLAFRLKEARAIVAEMRSGSAAELLLGHGLGATFRLATAGYSNRGTVVQFGATNFIHNLYLFLLFKLGVLGTALFLAALALWTVDCARAALTFAPSTPERLFAAGAAAVWVSYAVMGLAAPHLVTYAQAPLLGLLLAAVARLDPAR